MQCPVIYKFRDATPTDLHKNTAPPDLRNTASTDLRRDAAQDAPGVDHGVGVASGAHVMDGGGAAPPSRGGTPLLPTLSTPPHVPFSLVFLLKTHTHTHTHTHTLTQTASFFQCNAMLPASESNMRQQSPFNAARMWPKTHTHTHTHTHIHTHCKFLSV